MAHDLMILPNGQRQALDIDPRDLDPKDQWTNRFPVNSSSTDVVHTVSQNKKKRYWGCSCNGWKRWKKCHHLDDLGLPCGRAGEPNHLKPYEPKMVSR